MSGSMKRVVHALFGREARTRPRWKSSLLMASRSGRTMLFDGVPTDSHVSLQVEVLSSSGIPHWIELLLNENSHGYKAFRTHGGSIQSVTLLISDPAGARASRFMRVSGSPVGLDEALKVLPDQSEVSVFMSTTSDSPRNSPPENENGSST